MPKDTFERIVLGGKLGLHQSGTPGEGFVVQHIARMSLT